VKEKVKIKKEKREQDIKKRTYIFALNIIKFIKILPRDFSAAALGKQLLRSGTSIGANIMEGQAASSKKDFVNYHLHSLKSANETKFWLSLIKDSGIISVEEASRLLLESKELSRIIAAIVLSAKNKRY
jgi:four helix bundle protein